MRTEEEDMEDDNKGTSEQGCGLMWFTRMATGRTRTQQSDDSSTRS